MKCDEVVDKGRTRIRGWHDYSPCGNVAKYKVTFISSGKVEYLCGVHLNRLKKNGVEFEIEKLKGVENETKKKTERHIKAQAGRLKRMYEAPHPEVDKIIAELREDVKNNPMPKNMTKDEEIAWILKEANGEDNLEKLQAIINEGETEQTAKLKESIVAHFQKACGASYSFRDILDNLDDDAIQEEIIKWARCNFLRLQIIGEKGE